MLKLPFSVYNVNYPKLSPANNTQKNFSNNANKSKAKKKKKHARQIKAEHFIINRYLFNLDRFPPGYFIHSLSICKQKIHLKLNLSSFDMQTNMEKINATVETKH